MEWINVKRVDPSFNSSEILFMDLNYADTTIVTSNGIRKSHSVILRKNSVFKDLLASQENKKEKLINFKTFSMETINVILEYLYRGSARYYKEISDEVMEAKEYFFKKQSECNYNTEEDSDKTYCEDLHDSTTELRLLTTNKNKEALNDIEKIIKGHKNELNSVSSNHSLSHNPGTSLETNFYTAEEAYPNREPIQDDVIIL